MKGLQQKILQVEEIELGLLDAKCRFFWHTPGLRGGLYLPGTGNLTGQHLNEAIPEFIGYEETIRELAASGNPVIFLNRIGRETPEGEPRYIALKLAPHEAGYLLTLRDDTPGGALEQKITQQRNELNLLSRQLSIAHRKIDQLFRRFVPPRVVDEMLEDSDLTNPGGKRRTATILFADLRNFTDWAEEHAPELVLAHLNSYMEKAIDVVLEAGGTINQFLGDGFITFFNAPQDQPSHAELALECARKIVGISPEIDGMRFGIGINTGLVVAGNIGSLKVMNYTVIGSAVNIASRLEKLAGPGEIVFGETTEVLLKARYDYQAVGPVKLKGIRNPMQVYKITQET